MIPGNVNKWWTLCIVNFLSSSSNQSMLMNGAIQRSASTNFNSIKNSWTIHVNSSNLCEAHFSSSHIDRLMKSDWKGQINLIKLCLCLYLEQTWIVVFNHMKKSSKKLLISIWQSAIQKQLKKSGLWFAF